METKLRTQEEINQEYTACAAHLGDKIHKQILLQGEINALHDKMRMLNQEKSLEKAEKETLTVVTPEVLPQE